MLTIQKLCSLYQIPVSALYDEKPTVQDQEPKQIGLIPENVAIGLLIKNSFISDLQRETICRYNDRIKKDAIMNRKEVEEFLPKIIGEKKQYSLADMISCCMAVNQKTLEKISRMELS